MSNFPDQNNPFSTPDQVAAKTPASKHAAIEKLKIPAIIMIVLAVLSILWSLASPFLGPAMNDMMMDSMMEMMPNEDAKREFQDQMEEQKNSGFQAITTWGGAIFGLIMGVLLLYGALKMKNASSYGWALAASILSILGFGFCCCFSTPVGIWGLVILLKEDVKNSFG